MILTKFELWTGEKTYEFLTGTIADPVTLVNEYSALGRQNVKHVVVTDQDKQIFYGFENLAKLRRIHEINESLCDEDAFIEIERIVNAKEIEAAERAKENDDTISLEERKVSAMETQNMIALAQIQAQLLISKGEQ